MLGRWKLKRSRPWPSTSPGTCPSRSIEDVDELDRRRLRHGLEYSACIHASVKTIEASDGDATELTRDPYTIYIYI